MSKYIQLAVLATIILYADAFAADETESPWIVHGRVTDDSGTPLEGVEVNAHCGMGTLHQTGSATTDRDGNYRLTFGRALGLSTEVATISPRMNGWYEIHLGNRGNLMVTDGKEQLTDNYTRSYSGVVEPNKPYELDFTMAKAATIQGRLVTKFGPINGVDIWLTGDILPPSSSVLATATTDDSGRFVFADVPVWLADPSIKLKWRFAIRPFGIRPELVSSSFEVSTDVESVQELTLESAGDDNEVRLFLKRKSVGPTDRS